MSDPSTLMRSNDRRLLAEFLQASREQQRAPTTMQRLRRAGWSLQTLSTLAGISIDEVIEKLREGTR